jgi:hypothetical protein
MFEAIKQADNSVFVRNTDVKQCEAIVFAESVRTGKTMLEVLHYVLYEDDSNTELLVACETVQEQIINKYKKQIIFEYLDAEAYKFDPAR